MLLLLLLLEPGKGWWLWGGDEVPEPELEQELDRPEEQERAEDDWSKIGKLFEENAPGKVGNLL